MSTTHFNRNTLSKSERLVSRTAIEKLLEKGKSFSKYPLKVRYLLESDDESAYPAQFAVSVPKRLFKRAVDRNKLKRRIRESYRVSKNNLYAHLDTKKCRLSIIVIYIGKEVADYHKIDTQMNVLLEHLIHEI